MTEPKKDVWSIMMSGTVETVPYTELNKFGRITKNVGADSISAHQRGITLIALVVTLVVLLILAGVTINIMLSEGGIIAKAQSSKEKQEVGVWLDRLTVTEANTAVTHYAVEELI